MHWDRHWDNWLGISLLYVVGKVMAETMKESLEVIAGKVLQNHSAVVGRNEVVWIYDLCS